MIHSNSQHARLFGKVLSREVKRHHHIQQFLTKKILRSSCEENPFIFVVGKGVALVIKYAHLVIVVVIQIFSAELFSF